VSQLTDADLSLRGTATLLASWEEYAGGAAAATVQRLPGVVAAVFPEGPERAVYNNALFDRDLGASERAEAMDAMQAAYAAAGVTHFAGWVHERDTAMSRDLERRGYTLDTTTCAMAMALDDIRLPRPSIELGPADWSEYLTAEGLPPDFLEGADHEVFHLMVARAEGQVVAASLAYDFGDDCGIYNVSTVQRARRRGLGTALTTAQLHDARARGRHTASLQSTSMAERMYAAIGFRSLGRILEYVPPLTGESSSST